jgi:hypothetical protein
VALRPIVAAQPGTALLRLHRQRQPAHAAPQKDVPPAGAATPSEVRSTDAAGRTPRPARFPGHDRHAGGLAGTTGGRGPRAARTSTGETATQMNNAVESVPPLSFIRGVRLEEPNSSELFGPVLSPAEGKRNLCDMRSPVGPPALADHSARNACRNGGMVVPPRKPKGNRALRRQPFRQTCRHLAERFRDSCQQPIRQVMKDTWRLPWPRRWPGLLERAPIAKSVG